MEQMMEHLLAKMESSHEKMEAMIKSRQERMMAKMRIPRGDESQPREYEGLDGSLSGNV
jgi:hypothetical protein